MLLIGGLTLGLLCWLIIRQLALAPKGAPAKLVGHCPNCRHTVESGWLLCPDCETRLRKSCSACGEIHDCWFNFCPWCGHAAATTNRP